MKRVSIFGFTGSIGTQALSIIEKYPSEFELDVLVCNKNITTAIDLIKTHKPKNIFVFDPDARIKIMAGSSNQINFFDSLESARSHINNNQSDIYLSAISSLFL